MEEMAWFKRAIPKSGNVGKGRAENIFAMAEWAFSAPSRPIYGRIQGKTARKNVVLFVQDNTAPSCPYKMPFGFGIVNDFGIILPLEAVRALHTFQTW